MQEPGTKSRVQIQKPVNLEGKRLIVNLQDYLAQQPTSW